MDTPTLWLLLAGSLVIAELMTDTFIYSCSHSVQQQRHWPLMQMDH